MRSPFAPAFVLVLALVATPLMADKSIPDLKAAAEEAVKAASAAPSDYDANWKAAQACRQYGDEMVTKAYDNWKSLAKAAAKDGMKYGEIAQKINPKGVEGWYWYGLDVGTYSDCVSILTAMSEGLKGKTQKSFETSYSLDKNYDEGGPILALGRFWQVLPGIAGRDLKKAEQLINEYISAYGEGPSPNKDAWYYRGGIYKDSGRQKEARADLEKAAAMGQKDAAKLLATMK